MLSTNLQNREGMTIIWVLDRTASVFVQCSYAFGRSVRRSQTWELPTQHFEYDAFHLDVLTSAEHDEGSLLLDWQNKMTGQRPTSFRYVMRPDGYLFQ
jgi:hypothetical protein